MHLVIMQPQMELRSMEHVHAAGRRPPLPALRQPKTMGAPRVPPMPVFFPPDGTVVNSGVGGPEPCSSPYQCRCKSCRPTTTPLVGSLFLFNPCSLPQTPDVQQQLLRLLRRLDMPAWIWIKLWDPTSNQCVYVSLACPL